jgi:hypothetical protein
VAWIVALALAIPLLLSLWHLLTLLRSGREPAVGDGKNVATYEFDLDPCLVPREAIIASGLPRDGLPALVYPQLMSVQAVDSLNHAERGKYLVHDDLVIGVVVDRQARAYPLRVLNWHEVVNDTLAGQAIAVTFNPLCDASVVFAREVAGEVLEFGVSGLLFNSNLLLYDRRPDRRGESLWSQLQGRAVTGPAAAARYRLQILPAAIMTWGAWCEQQPLTTVPFPTQTYRQRYQRNPYGVYAGSETLRFPVAPLPSQPLPGELEVRYKARIVAIRWQGEWQVYSRRALVDLCRPAGEWRSIRSGTEFCFRYSDDPFTSAVTLGDAEEPVPSVSSYWFAWYAHHPDCEPIAIP